jgi:hypothetical protein
MNKKIVDYLLSKTFRSKKYLFKITKIEQVHPLESEDYESVLICLIEFIQKPNDNYENILLNHIELDLNEYLNTYFSEKVSVWAYTDEEKFERRKQRYLREFNIPSLIKRLLREQEYASNRDHINNQNSKIFKVLTEKIGLTSTLADDLIQMLGKRAIWFVNAFIQFHINKFNYKKEEVIKAWNKQGLSSHIRNNIRMIMDWLQHPLSGRQDLSQLTYETAIDKAEQFHEYLKQFAGASFDYKETDTVIKRYPKTENGVEFYWAFIDNNYCSRESERMGHCGRTGYSNRLFSLRSIKPHGNHTLTDSHVTVAWDRRDGIMYQSKGKSNSKPKAEYFPYIYDLILTSLTTPIFEEIDMEPFSGFGSEYESSKDYNWSDMTAEQIKTLYQIKPELFNNRAAKKIAGEMGLIPNYQPPQTKFTLNLNVSEYSDYIDCSNYNYTRKNHKGERVHYDICVDYIENGGFDSGIYDNYYDNNDWKHYIDYLNENNIAAVWAYIEKTLGRTKDELLEEYDDLEEIIDDNEDDLDELTNIINSCVADALQSDYTDTVVESIKSAIEELGTLKEWDYEHAVIEIDLNNFNLDADYLEEYAERCDDDPKCMYNEAVGDGSIEKPKLFIDDRYGPSVDSNVLNDIFHDRVGELS